MKNQKFATGKAAFLLIFVVVGIYFYHDFLSFVYSISLSIGCISFAVIPFFWLLVIGVPVRLLFLARQAAHLKEQLILITLLVCFFILVFNAFKLSVLKDILFYELNKPFFEQIQQIGMDSKCYQSDGNCVEFVDLPDDLSAVFNQADMFTTSNPHTVTILSRDFLFFVSSDTIILNHQYKPATTYYQCFVQLDSHWFLCELASGN